jgi:PHD/YefM family antitoxin component YafN of YafNO toxin-antitoxin module
MDYLLYSSKEMFSSTDLIRKSKMIFDKVNSNEISKAIILRDGKPSFIMLDFDKYEEMMKEYQLLKGNKQCDQSVKNDVQNHTKPKEQILKVATKEIITKEVVNFQDEESELLKTLNDLDNMNFDDLDEKELKSLDEFDDEVEDYDDEIDEDLEDFEEERKSKEQPLKDFWE